MLRKFNLNHYRQAKIWSQSRKKLPTIIVKKFQPFKPAAVFLLWPKFTRGLVHFPHPKPVPRLTQLPVSLPVLCTHSWNASTSVNTLMVAGWLNTLMVAGWMNTLMVAGWLNTLMVARWLNTLTVAGWFNTLMVAGWLIEWSTDRYENVTVTSHAADGGSFWKITLNMLN